MPLLRYEVEKWKKSDALVKKGDGTGPEPAWKAQMKKDLKSDGADKPAPAKRYNHAWWKAASKPSS